MNTSVTAGAAIAADDSEVMKAIAAATNVSGTLSRPSGLQWLVGVRNESQVVYRRVTFNTRSQLMRLALRMDKIGYADELATMTGTQDGFDAIYSRVSAAQPSEPAPLQASCHSVT